MEIYNRLNEDEKSLFRKDLEENFSIEIKIDTNNPIYKFYEKEVGKYLKNNYAGKLITDDK